MFFHISSCSHASKKGINLFKRPEWDLNPRFHKEQD